MEVTLVGESTPRNMPVNGPAISTTAPATGNWIYKEVLHCTYQVIAAAAATVIIEGSNDGVNAVPVTGTAGTSTITLAGAGTGVVIDPVATAFRFVRARVTAATAATSVLMGV